uniref:Uncharacterized protein n=1 Tax=Knipowitschia caucasica TaxID=637954 RepID=A0AAV2L5I1_KNICA
MHILRQYYRLPEGTLELAKISKVLMAMEQGRVTEFEGKSLDQIQIEPEGRAILKCHGNTNSGSLWNPQCPECHRLLRFPCPGAMIALGLDRVLIGFGSRCRGVPRFRCNGFQAPKRNGACEKTFKWKYRDVSLAPVLTWASSSDRSERRRRDDKILRRSVLTAFVSPFKAVVKGFFNSGLR